MKDKIIITGGYGFIGSNLIETLYKNNKFHIINFEILENKIDTLKKINPKIKTYNYKKIFTYLKKNKRIKHVIHLGAISDTKYNNIKKIRSLNYKYSKKLFMHCHLNKVNFIYASSAAVYGNSKFFKDGINIKQFDKYDPNNAYAKSKYDFDKYIINFLKEKKITANVIGYRFFNVYGINEFHKEGQSSPILKFYNDFKENNEIVYFKDKQIFNKRDFIYIDDVVKVIIKSLKLRKFFNILNLGTSKSKSFEYVAKKMAEIFKCKISQKKFSNKLLKGYQFYTKSDNRNFNKIFPNFNFHEIDAGIKKYLKELN
jgi:ADP-L-glycero-D-manno-heptose 6-epimerase